MALEEGPGRDHDKEGHRCSGQPDIYSQPDVLEYVADEEGKDLSRASQHGAAGAIGCSRRSIVLHLR